MTKWTKEELEDMLHDVVASLPLTYEEFIDSLNDFQYWLSDRVYYENKKET